MKKYFSTFLVLMMVGCASHQSYVGVVTNCENKPIASATVEAWKNQWLPFHLPVRLGETQTDEDGVFTLNTEKGASFFVYSGKQMVLSSHPNKSESSCAK
ncbi:hypothetical protein [Teredinibacter waterburyi]|uniref:hypothetical protein n=1 Tax=Teredinibacter waterburyi TaxID=1500538 RepID=UPI00165FACB9|nr:hypothetical protein [Teredinibacter waterburyi]